MVENKSKIAEVTNATTKQAVVFIGIIILGLSSETLEEQSIRKYTDFPGSS